MQYDPREVIRQVKQPVLIVNGDNDIQISADNAEALAQARPDADKVIIEGMTHLLKQSEVTDPQRQKNDYLYGCCRACFRKVSDGHGGFHPPDMTFCRRGERRPRPGDSATSHAARGIIIFSTTGTEKCPGNTNCRIFRSHCV